MLAFDIETTGLDPMRSEVTCLCLYDPDEGIERTFIPPLGDDLGEAFRIMDTTSVLCAFNGARFDLPFIQHQLRASPERVLGWRLKLHDVFEACKLALNITFPLKALLALNDLPGKTGSGADAIQLALDGDWSRLGEYCLNDTRVTHRVSSLHVILLPCTRV